MLRRTERLWQSRRQAKLLFGRAAVRLNCCVAEPMPSETTVMQSRRETECMFRLAIVAQKR